ncbi:MAG: hypothetical protein R3E56_10235 [Burkholderiaceae bacterium]
MSDDTQFETFEASLADFMNRSNALVDHVLSGQGLDPTPGPADPLGQRSHVGIH